MEIAVSTRISKAPALQLSVVAKSTLCNMYMLQRLQGHVLASPCSAGASYSTSCLLRVGRRRRRERRTEHSGFVYVHAATTSGPRMTRDIHGTVVRLYQRTTAADCRRTVVFYCDLCPIGDGSTSH